VTLRASAPTPGEAAAALEQLRLTGAGRRLLAADGAQEQEQGSCGEAEARVEALEAALAASEAQVAALLAAGQD
jgi:hypothetical protein